MYFLRTRKPSSGREGLAGDTTLGIASGSKKRRKFRLGPGNEATLGKICIIYAKRYLLIWMEPDHT